MRSATVIILLVVVAQPHAQNMDMETAAMIGMEQELTTMAPKWVPLHVERGFDGPKKSWTNKEIYVRNLEITEAELSARPTLQPLAEESRASLDEKLIEIERLNRTASAAFAGIQQAAAAAANAAETATATVETAETAEDRSEALQKAAGAAEWVAEAMTRAAVIWPAAARAIAIAQPEERDAEEELIATTGAAEDIYSVKAWAGQIKEEASAVLLEHSDLTQRLEDLTLKPEHARDSPERGSSKWNHKLLEGKTEAEELGAKVRVNGLVQAVAEGSERAKGEVVQAANESMRLIGQAVETMRERVAKAPPSAELFAQASPDYGPDIIAPALVLTSVLTASGVASNVFWFRCDASTMGKEPLLAPYSISVT